MQIFKLRFKSILYALSFGLAILFCLFFARICLAGDVAISSDVKFINITPYMDYFEDPTGKLTISDISSRKIYDQFVPVGSDTFHEGLTNSTYWLRVRLGTSQSFSWGSKWLIEIPKLNMGEITLYVPDFTHKDGFYSESAPSLSTFGREPGSYRNTVFPITSGMGGKTIFLEVKSSWAVSFPVYIWEGQTYTKEIGYRGILFGLCCGVILGSGFFVLLLGGIRNWRIGLSFAAYTFFGVTFLASLRGYTQLLSHSYGYIYQIVELLLCGVSVFSLLVTMLLLDLKTYAPKINRLAKLFLFLPLADLLIASFVPLGQSLFLIFVISVLIALFKLYVTVYRIRQGLKQAIWFLASMLVLYFSWIIYFANGVLWPNLSFNQEVLGWGAGFSVLLGSVSIVLIVGMNDLKKLLQGERISNLDPYDISTGLYSKAYFISRFTEELNHCHRVQQPLSLLLIDLDGLGESNEKYGVLFSDQVIVALGEIIKENAGRFSAGGRLGGGHFGLQLSEMTIKEALTTAEKIRNDFAAIEFHLDDYAQVKGEEARLAAVGALQFTVCIGVAEAIDEDTSWEDVFARAEGELVLAKQRGKGSVSPDPSVRGLL